MKYTKEEKLNIGRRLYEGELTRYQEAEEYDIGENNAPLLLAHVSGFESTAAKGERIIHK